MKDPILWVFVLAVALVGAGVYYFQYGEQAPVPVAEPDAAPATEPDAAPAVRYPVPGAPLPAPAAAEPEPSPPADAEPAPEQAPQLPPLDASDALLHGELERLSPGQRLGDHLYLDRMARRFVVSIDNLSAIKLPRKQLFTRPVEGRFAVTGEDDALYLSPGNFLRYTPFVQLVESIDTEALLALYVRVYPLLQQAYEELGYPSAYFNDRLVEVIDHLLEAPDIDAPVRLVRPRVLYQFADAELEALSAGQKVLVRVGPDNAARLKSRLRELRAGLVGLTSSTARAGAPND